MQSHVFRFPTREGEPVAWFLCSDLHLGHRCCDEARIHRELSRAVKHNAAILINGDVFDAVTTGDKRYTPGETIDRIANARDALRATVDYGCEVLGPYASHIKVIGIGNHETAWLKYRQSDPVALLIDRLNARGATIQHGGISGFVVSLLDVGTGRHKHVSSHVMYYHHGTGGDSPVTGGLIAAQRATVMVRADAITQGHRHNHIQREITQIECRPNGRIVHKPVMQILTGSYFRNYAKSETPLQYSYAEEHAHPPKPLGGHYLWLTAERTHEDGERVWRVRQDHMTAMCPSLG